MKTGRNSILGRLSTHMHQPPGLFVQDTKLSKINVYNFSQSAKKQPFFHTFHADPVRQNDDSIKMVHLPLSQSFFIM